MSDVRKPDARMCVLVTGATHPSSLGSALALAFLDNGFRVIVTAQKPISRAAWLEEKGCEVLELELSDDASIVNLANEVKVLTGGVLDVLINNVSLEYGFAPEVTIYRHLL